MSLEEQIAWETDLVQRCEAGDAEAWCELVRRYERRVAKCLINLLGDRAKDHGLVEDCVQEVWTALLDPGRHRFGRFDARKGRLATFLYLIARFVFLDLCKKPYLVSLSGRRDRQVFSLGRDDRTQLQDPLDDLAVMLADLAPEFSPREFEIARDQLGLRQGEPPLAISPANRRKICERLRVKVKKYINAVQMVTGSPPKQRDGVRAVLTIPLV